MPERRWWRWRRSSDRRNLACRDVVALLTDYLDEALPSLTRQRLDAHLSDCPYCQEFLAQLRLTIEVSGRVTAADLDPQARRKVVAAFRDWRPS